MTDNSNTNTFIKTINTEHISNRILFIKNLLKGKQLEPIVMIDFDHCNTEYIEKTRDEYDIRNVIYKKVLDFNKIINEIGGKLEYIKSGTTGHTFKGSSIIDPQNKDKMLNYAVKIVAYPKRENYGDMNDVERPENAELIMLRTLSYFVCNQQTPHIVLPIATFNTEIKPFINLIRENAKGNKKFDEFMKKYKHGDYYDKISVLISEWANGGDLLDYIRANYKIMTLKEWRVMFFQILSSLAVIHKKYPSFRHNDMKANNILLQISDNKSNDTKYRYKVNGMEYMVPNIGIQIKLWDFDFACIPGIVDNAKVDAEWTKKINIKSQMNRYYDVHYFFNTLTKKGFFDHFWDAKEIPQKVKEFVRRVVPEKYAEGEFVSERGRILVDKEYTTPDEIIKIDPFFEKMRIEK
jgi:serine/threonine protein kinase